MARYRTIGAISGYFPTAAERRAAEAAQAQSLGAQMHRDEMAAEQLVEAARAAHPPWHCPVCGTRQVGRPAAERCHCCATSGQHGRHWVEIDPGCWGWVDESRIIAAASDDDPEVSDWASSLVTRLGLVTP